MVQPEKLVVQDRSESFRLLVESVRDYAIFMLDPRGHVTTWNVGAERIKGYRADEIIGKHFSVFYPPEDIAAGKPPFELVEAEREGRFEDEGWRLRKDGSRFWANVVITAVRDARGVLRGFAKVTRDLTARMEAEATARELAREQAARAEAEKSETFQRHLLAILAHDLRNSLSVVLAAAEMMRVSPADPQTVGRRAGQVVSGARRMAKMIRSIIDYVHVQLPEGLPMAPRDGADFHQVCQRLVEEFRVTNGSREIRYDCEGAPTGRWDEERLEQVVQNLLGNALKYGAPGTPISIRWWRSDDESDESDLLLAVHNEGPAIPAELQPHIFEPFRSGTQPGPGSKESMGLGLFIVSEIVRAHGGEVRVASDAEHGTTFTVRLPGRAAARPVASRATAVPAAPPA